MFVAATFLLADPCKPPTMVIIVTTCIVPKKAFITLSTDQDSKISEGGSRTHLTKQLNDVLNTVDFDFCQILHIDSFPYILSHLHESTEMLYSEQFHATNYNDITDQTGCGICTCKFVDVGSSKSVICSLYISRKEHLVINFRFSSLRCSSSCGANRLQIQI